MLDFLSIRLKAEDTKTVLDSAGFHLTDTDEKLGMVVRRGVAEALNDYPDDTSVLLALSKTAFYRVAVMAEPLAPLIKAGEVELLRGATSDADRFFGYFEDRAERYPPVTVPAVMH